MRPGAPTIAPAALLLSLLSLLALLACGGTGAEQAQGAATMRPGEDCLSCHAGFTAAGTVYGSADAAAGDGVPGVTVTIVGADADVVVTTNAAGNFHTTAPFGLPASVSLALGGTTRAMGPTQLTARAHGGCASCHPAGSRVHLP
jgi:hypothetical protein